MNTKRILIFITFVMVVSWAVAQAFKLSAMLETNPADGMMLANYIIITLPALANIFTRLVTKEGWGNLGLLPNFKRGGRFYLAACLLPLLGAMVGGAYFYLISPQSFDPYISLVWSFLVDLPSWPVPPLLAYLIPYLIVQTILVAMVFIGIAPLGEEFGWRAYLLQKLMVLFAGTEGGAANPQAHAYAGARRASLLVGLIWGVWSYPLYFLSSTLTFPFILNYLVFSCSANVLLSWVALRSGSVWPASIGHGMLNVTTILLTFMSNAAASPLLGPGPTGLVGLLGYLILALALLIHPRAFAREPDARLEETQPVHPPPS